MYSVKVGSTGRWRGTASSPCGDRPIRSSSRSAASTTACSDALVSAVIAGLLRRQGTGDGRGWPDRPQRTVGGQHVLARPGSQQDQVTGRQPATAADRKNGVWGD